MINLPRLEDDPNQTEINEILGFKPIRHHRNPSADSSSKDFNLLDLRSIEALNIAPFLHAVLLAQ